MSRHKNEHSISVTMCFARFQRCAKAEKQLSKKRTDVAQKLHAKQISWGGVFQIKLLPLAKTFVVFYITPVEAFHCKLPGRATSCFCCVAHCYQTTSTHTHFYKFAKADSTLRSSQVVPHPSTNRALSRLTSEVERDPVHST